MSYFALVTKLLDYKKDENSNNLYIATCCGEGVVMGPDAEEGQLVLYLPQDGKVERWFGDKLRLFRNNEDGTKQGGYIDDNGHIRALKLRGNKSEGIAIPLTKIYKIFGNQNWQEGDRVTSIANKEFCSKYISKQKISISTSKTSYKGRKVNEVIYPEFSMHINTEQLMYNLDKFKPGDIINLSLKMHGTSSRHMKTIAELPNGFFRRLFHMKKKTKPVYVCGTRRCVVIENSQGYYGNDEFRMKHHKELEPYIEENQEIYAEIVGYYGPNESDTIMPIGDNTKMNDKNFIKEFGKHTVFSYGCKPGESKLYIYRITSNNGEKEWTPDEIIEWCNKNGLLHVPYIDTFTFSTVDDLLNRINEYFKDLHDPIGGHIKEGVVVRILNRPWFVAYKMKTMEFKIIEGLIKDSSDHPDMEEAEEGV